MGARSLGDDSGAPQDHAVSRPARLAGRAVSTRRLGRCDEGSTEIRTLEELCAGGLGHVARRRVSQIARAAGTDTATNTPLESASDGETVSGYREVSAKFCRFCDLARGTLFSRFRALDTMCRYCWRDVTRKWHSLQASLEVLLSKSLLDTSDEVAPAA